MEEPAEDANVSQKKPAGVVAKPPVQVVSCRVMSEEDKRATTNVQNGLAFFFLFSLSFSFRLFELNSSKTPWF